MVAFEINSIPQQFSRGKTSITVGAMPPADNLSSLTKASFLETYDIYQCSPTFWLAPRKGSHRDVRFCTGLS
jgi:hypothetical protein